ncbi:hypothetical protein V2G26_013608 [Clonostachys chloroleuca]
MPSTTLDPSRHATLIRIRHKHIIQAKHITNTLGVDESLTHVTNRLPSDTLTRQMTRRCEQRVRPCLVYLVYVSLADRYPRLQKTDILWAVH